MGDEKDMSVFREYAEGFKRLHDQSAPTEERMKELELADEEEDASKGFKAAARKRKWEQWRERVLGPVKLELDFSPRVRVKPDRIKVAWKDHNGLGKITNAVEVSMHGVKFLCEGSDPALVNALSFPRSSATIGVKNAVFYSRDGDLAIFRLVEFDNNVDGWMTWIEKLSRINKE